MIGMDLRQIRHFAAVVERGGFARAAEHCHVSQPAISATIALLEARLGMPLLERGAFGARPTPAGAQLYERAKLILAEVGRAIDEMEALRDGEEGSVAIGIGPLFEHTMMPEVLARFIATRTRVSVSAVVGLTGELFERLAHGELDMTISSPPGAIVRPADLDIEILQHTHDVVVAAADHPIWTSQDQSIAALANCRWIVSAQVGEAARSFVEAFAAAGVPAPRTTVRTDSIPILRELVLRQQFLCVVSPHFAAPLLNESVTTRRLRTLECAYFASPRQICLATRSGALMTRAAKELFQVVYDTCRTELIF